MSDKPNMVCIKPTPVPEGFSDHFTRPLPPRSTGKIDRSREPYFSHHALCGAMEIYHEARFAAPRQEGEVMDISLRHAHIPDLTPMCLAVYEPDGLKRITAVSIYSPMTKTWSVPNAPIILANKTRMWQLSPVYMFELVHPDKTPFIRIRVSHLWQKTRVKRDFTIGMSFVACGCQRIPMEHKLD